MKTKLTDSDLGQRVIGAAARAHERVPSDDGEDGWQLDVKRVAELAGCTVAEADAVLQDIFCGDVTSVANDN